MAKKASRRLVYVVSSNSSNVGHSLGVNSLAIDPTSQAASANSGLLYSAGRDGLINVWGLNDMNLSGERDVLAMADVTSDIKDISKENSENSKENSKEDSKEKSKDSSKKPAHGSTTNITQAQVHTNWINEIVLVNNYKTVASCSSDLMVKLWTPDTDQQVVVGQHLDYVKCLASPAPTSNWIVSGGLDRHINGWDIGENRGQTFSIDVGSNGSNPKGSIYALAVNNSVSDSGHSLIAAGGPESVVRLWDSRDTSSTVAQFVGHTDNIRSILVSQNCDWVLSASSDSTIKLWSMTASRLYYTFDMHDAAVWSLFSHHPNLDVFYSSDKSGLIVKTDLRGCTLKQDPDDAFCTFLCNEHEGVSKIVVAGDYLWAGTANSRIHRWQNVDTTPYAYDISTTKSPSPTDDSSRASQVNKLSALLPQSDSSPAINLTAASAPATAPASPVLSPKQASAAVTADVAKRFISTPFVHVNGTPALELIPPAEYEGREGDITVTVNPKYENPAETLQGTIGLIKHRLLTNRRQVLTLDTSGDIKLWDLLRGVPLKSFDRGAYDIGDLADQLSSFETVPNWCSVSIRAGELFVSLDASSCFDSEIYADTLEEDVKNALKITEFRPDHRINIGKWVIRNLLANFLDAELDKESKRSELLGVGFAESSPINGSAPKNPFGDDQTMIETVKVAAPPPTPAAPESEKKQQSGGKFRLFGKSKKDKEKEKDAKEKANTPARPPEPVPAPRPVVRESPDVNVKEMLDRLRKKRDPIKFTPPDEEDAPVLTFPAHTKLIISEQSPNSGEAVDLYRGTVGTVGEDLATLEDVVPDWIGRALLLNELPAKELPKVGFVIQPYDENTLPTLTNANVRLSAYHIIRARKVLSYLEERLNGATIPRDLDVQKRQVPENWLELYCQGQRVAPSMTLATIRTRLWRSGGDVVLKYRMKA